MKEGFKKPENNTEIIKPIFSKTVSEEEAVLITERFFHYMNYPENRDEILKELNELKETGDHLRLGPWNLEWDGNKIFIHVSENPENNSENAKLMHKIIDSESE